MFGKRWTVCPRFPPIAPASAALFFVRFYLRPLLNELLPLPSPMIVRSSKTMQRLGQFLKAKEKHTGCGSSN